MAFEQVRRLQPKRAGVYNNLGMLYFNYGQFEKAVAAFQEGLRLKPKGKENDISLAEGGTREDLFIYLYIGDAYERLDKNELALEFYQRAKGEKSDYDKYMAGPIAARMGLVYEKMDDADKALGAYESIDLTNGLFDYEATDKAPEIQARMGLLYAARKDYERAANSLEKAIQGYAENLKTQNESEPLEEEKPELIVEWERETQALKSAIGSASYNLGVVYLNLNKNEDAVAAFQKAVEVDPCECRSAIQSGICFSFTRQQGGRTRRD